MAAMSSTSISPFSTSTPTCGGNHTFRCSSQSSFLVLLRKFFDLLTKRHFLPFHSIGGISTPRRSLRSLTLYLAMPIVVRTSSA